MYIALRLLRDGAHTTITTALPAGRRRAASPRWPTAPSGCIACGSSGIDLREPGQVIALADAVASHGPLDILINNAAQTVRRSPEAYAHLTRAAQAPLPDGPLPEVVTLGRASGRTARLSGLPETAWAPTPHALTALALTAGSASPDRIAAGTRDRRGRPRARPPTPTTAGAR